MIYPPSFLEFCKTLQQKQTSLRKQILYVLWASNKPLKAYEILNQLSETKLKIQPPSIYRVLDYFIACGVIHKIESIQSYTLCNASDKDHLSEILMVCQQCNHVQKTYNESLHDLLNQLSQFYQFSLGENPVELRGMCLHCH